MGRLPFNVANNWPGVPDLRERVSWRAATSGLPHVLYEAEVGALAWAVRLNDFPDEPLYTLIIDGTEILHFDDWPAFWGKQPHLPRDAPRATDG